MRENSRLTAGCLMLVVLAAVGFYISQMDAARFGSYHDDGIYVVTAKALATGQGYRIVSLPDQPAQTKYPPFYPFLLSLVWRLCPDFPGNLRPMMGLSVVMAALFLIVTYGYLVRRKYAGRWLALAVVTLMAFNWRIILLSGSLYSELTYMVLSVLALWVSERYAEARGLRLGWLAGLLCGLAFLTRSIGLSLAAAAVLYLLVKRQYKKLLVLVTASALLIVPWQVWQQVNRSQAATPAAVYYTSYLATFRANVDDPSFLPKIMAKNLFYLTMLYTPIITLSLEDEPFGEPLRIPVIYFGLALIIAGFFMRGSGGVRLSEIYVGVYFGLLLILPYLSYGRYLLPLLPFLLLYLLTPVQRFFSKRSEARPLGSLRSIKRAALAGLLIVMGGWLLYGYVSLVAGMHKGPKLYTLVRGQTIYRDQAWRQALLMEWLRTHTAPADVILAYRDPVIYLYTGRRAIRSLLLRSGRRYFYSGVQPTDCPEAQMIFDMIRDNHADYLVITADDWDLEYYPQIVRQGIEKVIAESPHVFTRVHETLPSYARIYRITRGPF